MKSNETNTKTRKQQLTKILNKHDLVRVFENRSVQSQKTDPLGSICLRYLKEIRVGYIAQNKLIYGECRGDNDSLHLDK